MPLFDSLQLQPEDPIFGVFKLFAEDARPHKVNLGVGTYRDTEGKPYILDCVRDAEAALLGQEFVREYLPIEGDAQLIKQAKELIFGTTLSEAFTGGLFTMQTVGGTGALFLGAQLLTQNYNTTFYIPNATWPNHKMIFNNAGCQIDQYFYYDEHSHQLNFKRMCEDILQMAPHSVLLLHASCQNPTGTDLSNDQWMELSALIKKRSLIPFFDFAYQGFKSSIDEDAFAIRYFLSQGHEMLVAQSFAKNFGLYSDRIGTLSLVTAHAHEAKKAESRLKQLARGNYSNPPSHGARLIVEILKSKNLKNNWLVELGNMRDRLKQMRHTLASGLQAKSNRYDWTYLNGQYGFFSFCGLSELQVLQLAKDYAIYMPQNGRINVASLNSHNMDYVIDAIIEVTHT